MQDWPSASCCGFTNGLTAYLTGDTGLFGDMSQLIAKFYNPGLMVINIGPGGNGPTALGAEDAAMVVQHWIRPNDRDAVACRRAGHVGGGLQANTRTELFSAQNTRSLTDVVLPISDVTLTFDGNGRCIGCPR